VVARGDIWLVALDLAKDRETQQTLPCVVVSPPEMDDHLHTVIVAPMTTKGHPAPFRVPVTFMRKSGLILLDQIYAVDKARLVKKEGEVDGRTMLIALQTLQEVFAE